MYHLHDGYKSKQYFCSYNLMWRVKKLHDCRLENYIRTYVTFERVLQLPVS